MAKKKKKQTESEEPRVVGRLGANGEIAPFESARVLGRVDDKGNRVAYIQAQKEDVAPVKKSTWLKKGMDDSGYAYTGTLDKINRFNASVLMTGVDILGNIGLGITKPVEGVGDFVQNRTADVLDFFGGDKAAEKIRKSAKKEWGVNRELEQSLASDNGMGIDDMSFLGQKGKSIPQGLGSVLLASATGGAGGAVFGTTAGASATSLGFMGVGAAGNAEQEALEQGATRKEARMYGLISGVGETLSEMMFGGLSQSSQVLGIGSGVFDSFDDAVASQLTKKINNKIVKNLLQAGFKATGEGVEEVVSGLFDAVGKKLTYMKDEDIKKLIEDENLLDSFLSGAFSAAISQAPGYVQSITTTDNGKVRLKNQSEIRDYITNLNAQEQQVVEQEIQDRINEEGKITKKRRIEIEKQVIEDLDRGYISADKIEKTLGENYNQERDTRLTESFNERARKTQAYENDISKYDEKQAKVIQKAIDSGLLNNSNKTHDFVDLIAKISADKGVDFDFTNNDRINESGFGIKGKTVNGYVKDGTINLNLESNQALNKTVGHEITHVLEGTDVYKELQNSLKSYLGEREWNNRIDELAETYKNVENANIENELTSDLVGEYVFNDEKFVKSLSTRNPNLFQKIFDEIKYMVKIATAGSKEARDLEKVKRAFEKAYRETSKTQEGTQYSVEGKEEISLSYAKQRFNRNMGKYSIGDNLEDAYLEHQLRKDELDKLYEYAKKKAYNDSELRELERRYNELLERDNPNQANEIQYSLNDYEEYQNETKVKLQEIRDTVGDDFANNLENQMNEYKEKHPLEYKIREFTKSRDAKNINDEFFKEHDSDYDKNSGTNTPDGRVTVLHLQKGDNLAKVSFTENQDKIWIDELYVKNQNQGYGSEIVNAIKEYANEQGKDVEAFKELSTAKGFWDKTLRNNTKYSLTDNQGRELSKEQQEYFKDSKLRNENGELEVVYHTTPNQFTVFDNTKLGENTEYSNTAFGFFVTPNKNFSQRFGDINQEGTKGNTMEMYANITNPITHPFYAGYKYEGEQLDNIVRDYMRATGNEQVISDLEASADEEGLSLYQTYMDMMLGEDPFETADFDREELIKNGYDAVEFVEGLDKDVNYNVSDSNEPVSSYAVFDSNQLKNIDNSKPTSNPDIRYSLSEDAETFKTPYGVEVVKNPSTDDYIQMRQDILEEYPWLRGEKILRQTYDEEGNVYYWNAYDAQHADVEPYINKKYNTRTFQNDGWWKNPIYKDSPKDYSYVDTSNFKYSLSDTDSQGKELTQGQKDFFKDVSPEVKDENNQLMRFYHGSNSEFTIFDLTKGSQSNSNAGVGFWFTPSMEGARNFADSVWYGNKTPTTFEVYLNMKNPKVYETYDNTEIRSNLKEQLDNTYKERKALTDKYSWETPSLTNLVSYMNYMDDAKLVENLKNNFKFKEENAKQYVEDAKKYIELNNQYKNIEKQFDDARWTDAYEQFRTDIYKIAGKSADDANTGGTGMALDNKEQVLKDYVNSLKEQGYDGIVIKNTVYDSNTMGGTNNQYVVFDPNQIKNVTNENPTDNADIRYQLGNNEVAPTSGWNVRSEDVRLQSAFKEAIAPLQEQVQELTKTIQNIVPSRALTEEEANEYATQTQEAFENEAAPIRNNLTPEENRRMDMLELLERNNMLNEEQRDEMTQLESKINPVYEDEEISPVDTLNDVRDIEEVGSPKVKAYQYEHPEVKPFFQEEARRMLSDLDNTQPAQRYAWESQERGQGTSWEFTGTKRLTSPEIAELKDSKWQYTYDDIRKGLNAIIDDHGAENIAVAKRIEFYLDERLRNGYDAWGVFDENGEQYHVEPNQDYLNMLAEQEWQNYFDDINSQYPLEQLQEPQYNLEDEETDFSDVKIDKDIQDMTVDDLNLEPFLQGLVKSSENQAERQQLRNELNEKREVKVPKNVELNKAKNRGLGLLVNEFAAIDDYSKRTGNKDIKFKADTYNNYQAIAQSNIETAQTDINGKRIGRSGNSIFEEAKKYGLEDTFDEYLKQWANVDRSKQGKGAANYTAKESYKIVKEMEAKNPRLKDLGKDMWQYYRNARHNLRDAGIISQEVSDMLGRMYPHYTPYISENIENYFTKDGELKPKATIKRAKGGAAIGELLSAEEAMQRYTKSEFNTIFGNDLYKEIVNTSNDIVQLGGDDRGMQFVNADNLYADKNGYYLTAYEDGNPITAKISEEMYRTLMRESRNRISDIEQTFSLVTKPLQGLSKLRRNILTSWSPTFIAKNFIKDFQEGIFNSKYTKDFVKNYPMAFKELATNTELAQQFKSLYGSGLTMGQFDIDSNNYNPSGKNRNFLKGIKNANELIELAPRYAEFKASIDHGASIQEAMYNAREVTTNFSRGGTLAKALNRNGFTFLNSSIQGFDKFIRNFSGENGAKGIVNSLAKAAIFGIAPAVFNELAFGSGDDKDEEYEALPDYIKDNYYIIKTGDGNFIRIPKGRVLSVFGSAARRTIETMEGEENAFEGYWNNVQQQIGINNPEENNIFAPLIQAMGGRKLDSGQTAGSAWYGGDIIPSRLQKERPEDQYDASIDKFSIWLGQKTGISPYKINYVLDQYTGGIGDIGLPMITEEANSDGSIIAPIKDQFTADTVTDNKYVGEFYDTYNKIYTGSKKTDEDILKKNYMSNISYQLSDLYKERREIQADTTLSKKEKYEKAQAIKAEINRLAKEGLDNYENISITGDYAEINGQEYQKTDDGWKKLSSNTSDEVNSLGLTNREKNNYIKTQQSISSIKQKYKGEDDYVGKKQDIIGEIINTNLDDEAKMNLYQDTYKDKFSNYATDLGFDADTYLEYKAQDFSADKDKNGKSISGSKKRKVFDYVNSMDIPYEQKLLLVKSEYNSFNTNNVEIIEYIENSGMSYDDKMDLYKTLGFKIDGDTISW